jgi:hypothetical protein
VGIKEFYKNALLYSPEVVESEESTPGSELAKASKIA